MLTAKIAKLVKWLQLQRIGIEVLDPVTVVQPSLFQSAAILVVVAIASYLNSSKYTPYFH